MMENLWWILILALWAMVFVLFGEKQSSEKAKRKAKRQLAKAKKGEKTMSTVINGLIGKRCQIPIYGEGVILDADDDFIKFENVDKKGKKSTVVLRIDELDRILVLENDNEE